MEDIKPFPKGYIYERMIFMFESYRGYYEDIFRIKKIINTGKITDLSDDDLAIMVATLIVNSKDLEKLGITDLKNYELWQLPSIYVAWIELGCIRYYYGRWSFDPIGASLDLIAETKTKVMKGEYGGI